MTSLFAALGFLTVFPVPRSSQEEPRALEGAVWWFPVAGLLIGAVLCLLDGLWGFVFPPAVQAVLTVVSLAGLSRGLHIDGLADTADGVFSFRSREKMLDIMRDPRSGPMGVVAVVSILALKMAAICSLPSPWRWKALLLAPVAGRCAMGLVMGLFSYARTEGGLATAFQSGRTKARAAWSGLSLLALAATVMGGPGVIFGGVCLASAWGFSAYVHGKIDGYTGDTLGATCEIIEAVWFLLFLL
ncbi:MAG: adenosylcobinamide-GDP ribazoletransferase [Elusimicrobia bacterium]|nr:adenosylcobinamide-GDP ribazoletransferase [Elusimicrobiota bacterium]